MNQPATWKVVTLGVTLTGLAFVGAATANADTTPAPATTTFVALDDDWTETYWDDNQRWNADWTETYWDD